VAMTLNVLGNWIFIFGHLGAPALGVTGAAIASSLATSIASLGLVAFFLWEGVKAPTIVPRLHARELWRMLRFGLPSGFNWFFEFFAFNFFVNVVVAGLGTTALAALMAVIQINSVAFMPAFGLASAGAIFVGEAIGRRAHAEVWPVVRLTGTVAAIWMGSIGMFYVALPHQLMGLFQPDGVSTEDLVRVGGTMLMLSAVWQLFDALDTRTRADRQLRGRVVVGLGEAEALLALVGDGHRADADVPPAGPAAGGDGIPARCFELDVDTEALGDLGCDIDVEAFEVAFRRQRRLRRVLRIGRYDQHAALAHDVEQVVRIVHVGRLLDWIVLGDLELTLQPMLVGCIAAGADHGGNVGHRRRSVRCRRRRIGRRRCRRVTRCSTRGQDQAGREKHGQPPANRHVHPPRYGCGP
jgi:hypothetical protein